MNFRESIRRAAPLTLSFIAAFGVFATAISTKKATEKLQKEKECNLNYEKEKKKLYFKHYSIPVLIGAGTIVCIFSSTKISKQNQALLTSAYALLDQTHKEYVSKVKQLKGEEMHQEIVDSIALDHCEPPLISSSTMLGDSYLDVETDEVKHIFYDAYLKKYFESTMSHVLQAEYHLNRNFMLGAEVTVADWCEFLGIDTDDIVKDNNWWYMQYAGFRVEEGLYWIDFNHRKVTRKDGTEVIVIEFVWEPSLEPEDLWY